MDTNEEIRPAFRSNKMVIACASSQEYAPYLSVYLQSIKEHASSDKFYDIIIFENSWSEDTQKRVKLSFATRNISIRFYNPDSFFRGVNLYTTFEYFSRECYYRLVAPLVLCNFDRILYTDIDLVVLGDIEAVFSIDMGGKAIAAAPEPIWGNFCSANTTIKGTNIREYTDNVLKIKPSEYHNTGVMLIDVEKYNKLDSFSKLLSLVKNNRFLYQEQDALNMVFKDDVVDLAQEWNYVIFKSHSSGYPENAKLCHFPSAPKPWTFPARPLGYIWWYYARRSPFYEEILETFLVNRIKASIDHSTQEDVGKDLMHQVDIVRDTLIRQTRHEMDTILKHQVEMIRDVLMFPEFRRKLKRIRMKILLSCGVRRQRYIQREQELKSKIKTIENYVKLGLEK